MYSYNCHNILFIVYNYLFYIFAHLTCSEQRLMLIQFFKFIHVSEIDKVGTDLDFFF